MNLTRKHKLSLIAQMIVGIATIVIGVLFIFRESLIWGLVTVAIQGILVATALLSIYRAVLNRDVSRALFSLGAIAMLVLVSVFDNFYIDVIAVFFGLWALFNAAVYSLDFYVALKDGSPGKILKFITVMFSLVTGVLLLLDTNRSKFIIDLQIGIYIMASGIVSAFSAVRMLLGNKVNWSLSLPVAFAALIPNFLIKNIRKIELENPEVFSDRITPTTGNFLSIYLYAKDEGPSRIGHLDIGYNETIYTYGAHDNFDRAKSMAYGAGVMIVGNETEFVQYAVDHGTTVFRFLLKLDAKQAKNIESRIATILEDAYYYDYPYQQDTAGENYLSRLRHAHLNLDFYKFKSGKFKTYNVFTTNCVIVASQIVEATGMKLIGLSGIATPGAYYEHLESQRSKPGTQVVMKRIYQKKT